MQDERESTFSKRQISVASLALKEKVLEMGFEMTDEQVIKLAKTVLFSNFDPGSCGCVRGGSRWSDNTYTPSKAYCDCGIVECKSAVLAWCDRNNAGLEREGYKQLGR